MSAKLKLSETRPKPTVLETTPAGLIFSPNLNRKGFYQDLLQELKKDSLRVICISADDKSAETQIRARAKKLGLTLLIASMEDKLYFKLVQLTGPQRAILETLKNEGSQGIMPLRAKKFECALESTLQDMSRLGYIKLSPQDKWYITDKGKEELLRNVD